MQHEACVVTIINTSYISTSYILHLTQYIIPYDGLPFNSQNIYDRLHQMIALITLPS